MRFKKKFKYRLGKRRRGYGSQRRILYSRARTIARSGLRRTGGYKYTPGYQRRILNSRPNSNLKTLGSFLNNPSMEPATKHRSLPECVKLSAAGGTTAAAGWVALLGKPDIQQEKGWVYGGKAGGESPAMKWFGVTEMYRNYNYQTCLGVKYYITITNDTTNVLQVYHGVKALPPGETGTVAEIWNGVDPRNVAIRSKVRTFQLGPKGSPDCVKRIKRIVFTKNYMTDSPMITQNRRDPNGTYDGTNEWEAPWAFYVLCMSEANMTAGNNRLSCIVNVQYRAVAYCKWTSKNNPFPSYQE